MPISSENLCQTLENILIEMKQKNIIEDFNVHYKASGPVNHGAPGEIVQRAIGQLRDLQKINDEELTIISDEEENESAEKLYKKDMEKGIVQIRASKKDMQARIDSFLKRKRMEVNEWNVREFCNRAYSPSKDEDSSTSDEEESSSSESSETPGQCARVDSTLTKVRDCKSHIKLSTVAEHWKPRFKKQNHINKLVQGSDSVAGQINKQDTCIAQHQEHAYYSLREAAEERIENMETHLKIKGESQDLPGLFRRLQELEERILALESTSPEYFTYRPETVREPHKRKYEEMSTYDINSRIKALKEELRNTKTSDNNNCF